jgi:serine protease Do
MPHLRNFLMVLILVFASPVTAQTQNKIDTMLPGVVKVISNLRPTNFIQEYTTGTRGQWSTGSGFVTSAEGHIVTNHHVIKNATEVWVTFYDQRMVRVKVVGFDEAIDLAVLVPIEPIGNVRVLNWGSSSQLKAGDDIFVIGNPLGLEFSVSQGIVSHPKREFINPFYAAIQTDASINQGNSGGPVFNIRGEVIGVAVSIASQSGGSQGLGFAIPSDIARVVVDVLKTGSPFQRRIIGIEVEQNWNITPNTVTPNGIRIKNVIANSFAARSGIQRNDIIVSFNNVPVNSIADLIIKLTASTGELRIGIIRNGAPQILVVRT